MNTTDQIPSRRGVVMGGGAAKDPHSGATTFHFATLNMDRDDCAPVTMPLSFLAHGVTPSPEEPDLLLLFEKHGPGACALDLKEQAVRHVLEAPAGRQFYGHGAFSPDGSLLYCTENDLEDEDRGYIAVRDGRDFSYLGDFPSHGRAPHDCILRPDGTLVVTNGGATTSGEDAAPSVTHVEVATGKLLRREPIPDPRLNAGHLAMTDDGALAVVSAPRPGLPEDGPGGISLRTADGTLRKMVSPEDIVALMTGETLSVAIHEPTNVVAATTPVGHLVTFWNLETGDLIKSLRVPNPRGVGVTLDGTELLVAFGVTAKVSRLRADTLEPVDAPGNKAGRVCAISGSHIWIHDTRAA